MARAQTSLLIRLMESSVLFSLVVACSTSSDGTTNPVAETGSIQVSAATTGSDLDSDGYTATVGSTNQSVATNGSTTFAGLATGSHTVTLSGVATNCDVSGPNPASATVAANQTTSVSFAVTCEAPDPTDEAIASLEDALFNAINALDNGTIDDLDQFSFEETRDQFQQALDADPNDETAAFGLAITTIFVLEDNTDIRALADEWDTWLLTHSIDELSGVDLLGAADPFFWPRASLPLDIRGRALGGLSDFHQMSRLLIPREAEFTDFYPPTLAEHQALLRDVIAPALETALAALNTVDSPEFIFVITERMQGETAAEADPLELDLTEILALRAVLEMTLAFVNAALAYLAEPSPWGATGFAAAFETGSTFGTLASDGAALLLDAQERLLRAVDLLEQGLDNLVAETDDQSDDIIKYNPTGFEDGLDPQDVQDARDFLADAEAALQGPRTITDDFGRGEVMLVVDASKFFTNPIQDLKAILPDYEVMNGKFRWSALTIEEWAFPDPTFNGILPEITSSQELLQETLDLQSLYWDFDFPQGDWRDLVLSPTNGLLAFAAQGFLGIVSADRTSVTFVPTLTEANYNGKAIAVRSTSPEVIALIADGRIFARPDDATSAWTQQSVTLPSGFWLDLVASSSGIFALSESGEMAEIDASLSSSTTLPQIQVCCTGFGAIAENGSQLLALTYDGNLFGTLDPTVGWNTQFALPNTSWWTALVAGPGGTIFAGADDGRIRQIAADFSGSDELPQIPMDYGLTALATNDDASELVAITYDGKMYSRPTDNVAAAWVEHAQIPRVRDFNFLVPNLERTTSR